MYQDTLTPKNIKMLKMVLIILYLKSRPGLLSCFFMKHG